MEAFSATSYGPGQFERLIFMASPRADCTRWEPEKHRGVHQAPCRRDILLLAGIEYPTQGRQR
jgi:hypothetical protein